MAGLSVAHGLVPPHPGPLAAIERLGADTGRTLFYSLIVALPVALVCGTALRPARQPAVPGTASAPMADQFDGSEPPRLAHRRWRSRSSTILMPVILMLLAALAQATMADGSAAAVDRVRREVRRWPCCSRRSLAMYTFGLACGFDRARMLRFAEESLGADRRRPAGRRRRRRLRPRARGGRGRHAPSRRSWAGCTCRRSSWAGSSRRCCAWRWARRRWRGDDGEHHGADTGAVPARQPGDARRVDRRRLADRVARQRRRLLAGEGVLQHDRRARRVATWTVLETVVSVTGARRASCCSAQVVG